MTLKVLIISHVQWESTYGAGTSLRLHVRSLTSESESEPEPEPEPDDNNLELSLISALPGKVIKKGRLWIKSDTYPFCTHDIFLLPTSMNYEGCGPIKKNLKAYVQKWVMGLFRIVGYLRLMLLLKNDYDLVHLNSVVLAPTAYLIKKRCRNRKLRIIMHVREFLQQPLSKREREYFASVDNFICIDRSVEKRLFSALGPECFQLSQVLSNPFITSSRRDFSNLLSLGNESTIKFGMIGALSEIKGVNFVAQAFLDSNIENCILIFVGDGEDRPTLEELQTQQPHRIKVLGAYENITEGGIYNNLDVVLRGDPSFRTGRTVFEALYAGRIVIMPGTEEDLNEDAHLCKFREQIVLFCPGSLASCSHALIHASKMARSNNRDSKPAKHNLDAYRDSVLDIYHIRRTDSKTSLTF